MSVMAATPRKQMEVEWEWFLANLEVWERRYLCQGDRELTLHDRFVEGKILIVDVQGKIDKALTHGKGVTD